MKPYRTLATVRLFTGIVGLTDDLVKWRANCLKKIEDSVYEIINEVVFKAGEVIGLEDPPKPYAKVLECLEPEPVAETVESSAVKDEMKAELKKTPPKKRGRPSAKTKA